MKKPHEKGDGYHENLHDRRNRFCRNIPGGPSYPGRSSGYNPHAGNYRQRSKKNNLSYLNGDPNSRGKWQEAVRDHDVIINLAGASIFSRWTQQQKIILRASRINTTKHLVEALPDNASHITFFSTSAVGYYGFHEDEELIESSPAGNDFLARLAHDWEAEAFRAQEKMRALSSPASVLCWVQTEERWGK